MHDDSVLVAVEAALRSPAFCVCGAQHTLNTHDGALWLECPKLSGPSRLPDGVASFFRQLAHERRHVIDLPEVESPMAA